MPTYICHSPKGLLSAGTKAELAAAITDLHTKATGAAAIFARVLFVEVKPSDSYLGGQRETEHSLFIHGHIRAGRPESVRDHLIRSLAQVIASIAALPAHAVWVYLDELPPRAMIEYGRVLPEPGDEEAWLAALPAAVSARS